MYQIYDGDYDEQHVQELEAFLAEKLEGAFHDADECCINNAESFEKDAYLEIVVDYGQDPDGWDEAEMVPLSDEDIRLLKTCIPAPGHGPYFCWEE